MKKFVLFSCILFSAVCCQKSSSFDQGQTPIKDGLSFTFEIRRDSRSLNKTFIVRKKDDETFELKEEDRRGEKPYWIMDKYFKTKEKDNLFRYAAVMHMAPIWLSPKALAKNAENKYKVVGEEEKFGYYTYKTKEDGTRGLIAYFEKNTGFLIYCHYDDMSAKLVGSNIPGL
jgi:hypothetical protein